MAAKGSGLGLAEPGHVPLSMAVAVPPIPLPPRPPAPTTVAHHRTACPGRTKGLTVPTWLLCTRIHLKVQYSANRQRESKMIPKMMPNILLCVPTVDAIN